MTEARVGIQIGATTPPAELPAIAAEAERLGYGEIWLAEDYFELGGIASAAMTLSATERIPVGLGVVAAAARHPAVTAMEFATLGGACPDRFSNLLAAGADRVILVPNPAGYRSTAGMVEQMLASTALVRASAVPV